MAVLKHTSPPAWPVAPSPRPSSTVPSASTRMAVARGSAQLAACAAPAACACVSFIAGLHVRGPRVVGAGRRGGELRKAIAMLREEINNALKEAMKSQDKRRVSTLRLVNSALKNADIEARGQGKEPLPDGEVLSVLQKMIKQRQESIELYEKGGRAELAAQEREEIEIIASYLPQQMSEAEIRAAVEAAVAETGAAGLKDMGKVMAALKARHSGKMDFAKASGLVKARLAG